jgi:hypothetical protein
LYDRSVPTIDTTDAAAAVQLEAYRRMSPGARLRVGLELTAISRGLLVDGIRKRHPDYDDEHARLAFLRLWLGPELFRAAYPGQPELEP